MFRNIIVNVKHLYFKLSSHIHLVIHKYLAVKLLALKVTTFGRDTILIIYYIVVLFIISFIILLHHSV